ncbi:hypothetical protein BH20VER1_BH20VER1_17920 [soil metagenome]
MRFEIGHVLCTDICGYSKLLITEQGERLRTLTDAVRATHEFRRADAEGNLVRIPTGDGMALVFRNSPEAPVECAIELSKALKVHPEIQVRMGVHSGPVNEVSDVNDRPNITGAGINMAQRVMDCGDAGHILLSKHLADNLEQYPRWRSSLHDLGECEVKHGVRVSLANLYGEDYGNPAVPKILGGTKRAQPAPSGRPWTARRLVILLFGLAIIAAGLSLFQLSRSKSSSGTAAATVLVPEKSIAVLPFENMSDNRENAFFADGVQDDVLTALSKIADLKVISRTSVMGYRAGTNRNLREISDVLGVAHVLEGSVRWSGSKVRVSAQLVDSRQNLQLWAEHYDRELSDIFVIQSDIAQQIAAQPQAKLSPREQAEINAPPTIDIAAYELYLRAKGVSRNAVDGRREIIEERIRLLSEAVARDPTFAAALCQLARAHLAAYWHNHDHTPARLELARRAIDDAAAVRPDDGDVHLARARLHYWGSRDYGSALAELELARRALPNAPEVVYFTSLIERRQGEWEKSIEHIQQAARMDPRDVNIFDNLATTQIALRRYADAARTLDQLLTWRPDDFNVRLTRAWVDVFARADLQALQSLLFSSDAQPGDADVAASARLHLALAQRDHAAAKAALAAYGQPELRPELSDLAYITPREWYEGLIASAQGDEKTARSAFLAARERAAAALSRRPDDARAVMMLAEIDARLGRGEEAIRGGERAVQLLPVAKDALDGPIILRRLAGIYAQISESARALDLLEQAAVTPNSIHYGSLKLDEVWDPVRTDPRFETIAASLAPRGGSR